MREPVFGLPGALDAQEFRGEAERNGSTVVDRSALVVTHLAEVIRRGPAVSCRAPTSRT